MTQGGGARFVRGPGRRERDKMFFFLFYNSSAIEYNIMSSVYSFHVCDTAAFSRVNGLDGGADIISMIINNNINKSRPRPGRQAGSQVASDERHDPASASPPRPEDGPGELRNERAPGRILYKLFLAFPSELRSPERVVHTRETEPRAFAKRKNRARRKFSNCCSFFLYIYSNNTMVEHVAVELDSSMFGTTCEPFFFWFSDADDMIILFCFKKYDANLFRSSSLLIKYNQPFASRFGYITVCRNVLVPKRKNKAIRDNGWVKLYKKNG